MERMYPMKCSNNKICFLKFSFLKKLLALNRLWAELLSIQSMCNSSETEFIADNISLYYFRF